MGAPARTETPAQKNTQPATTHANTCTHSEGNWDAELIQTAPAPWSESAEGVDAKCLTFCNNYPYREWRRHVCAILCKCTWVGWVGVIFSCNIHPRWEGPDLTSVLIWPLLTEPVHFAQSSHHPHIVPSPLAAVPGWTQIRAESKSSCPSLLCWTLSAFLGPIPH